MMQRAVLAIWLCLLVTEARANDRRVAVEADYETLRAVIVVSIDESIYKSTEMGASIHPILFLMPRVSIAPRLRSLRATIAPAFTQRTAIWGDCSPNAKR